MVLQSSLMQPNNVDIIHGDANVPGEVYLIKVKSHDESTTIVLNPMPSNDPNDPLNWSMWRKMFNWMQVFAFTVAVFTSLSIQTIFWQQMSKSLNVSFQQLNNAQSTNLAGLAVGCILFVPFSKKYGRRSTYILSVLVMSAMAIWISRLNTIGELYAANLINGLAGATNEALSQMTISDLFFVHQRGRINALYLTAVMVGTFLAPLLGGSQAQNMGWRASYLTLGISLAVLLILFVFGFEETKYVPHIEGLTSEQSDGIQKNSETKSCKNRHETISDSPQSPAAAHSIPPAKTYWQRLKLLEPTSESLWGLFLFPLRVIWIPHILFTAIQYAAGILWLSVVAYMTSRIFSVPPYGFNTRQLGLMGLGPFAGNLLGSIYAGFASDWVITYLSKKHGGWYHPEFRLYPMIPSSFLQAGGLILFGTTAARGMHWIYPSIGGAMFAFGLGTMGDITFTFVIDTYRPLTAEAFVGIAFIRNAVAVGIPFSVDSWIARTGISNMFIMIGSLSLFISLLSVVMVIWGRQVRVFFSPYYYKTLDKQASVHA